MTVVPSETGGAVVPVGPNGEIVGLEDVEATDLVIPRLRINHQEGIFEDPLTNTNYEDLNCVILGLVKQRIMWDDEVGEGDKPLCKSPDHDHGFPQLSEDLPKDKRFPWARSNFSADSFSPDPELNGHIALPCSQCIFQLWDQGDWKQPPCSEQHTYIIMFDPSGENDDSGLSPALITFQRTGIKPSRKYLSSFKQANQPMFVVRSTLSLQKLSRGSVTYSVPVFTRGDKTDSEMWGGFAQTVKGIRDFIRQPPRSADDEVEGEGGGTEEPKAEPKKEPAKVASAAATSAPAEDDDDLPF